MLRKGRVTTRLNPESERPCTNFSNADLLPKFAVRWKKATMKKFRGCQIEIWGELISILTEVMTRVKRSRLLPCCSFDRQLSQTDVEFVSSIDRIGYSSTEMLKTDGSSRVYLTIQQKARARVALG